MTAEFETILLEHKGRIALITLYRPKALNALNSQVLTDISAALDELESDDEVGRAGLVSRIVPAADLVSTALEAAATIASMSLPSVMIAKEAVNRAFETTLGEGLRFERRVFHSLFATADQKEGMAAFVEK